MRHGLLPIFAALFVGFTVPLPANAAPTAEQTCKKMIADGRAKDMSQQDCLCAYRVAEVTLDDDIQALIFESWYTGAGNMEKLEKLPRPGRVERQMTTMLRTMSKNCPAAYGTMFNAP